MFAFKKLWEQLKSGEDVDLFLYLLIYGVLGVAAFSGYAPKNQGFSFLATGVSFILYSILSLRYLSKQILDKLSTPNLHDPIVQKVDQILENISTPSIHNYTTQWPDNLNDDLKKANNLSIYGIHLYITIDQYFRLFEDKVTRGGTLKFLFADPNGAVCNMVKLRYPGKVVADDQMTISCIDRVKSLKRQYPDNIYIKTLDYLFPRAAYIIDPEISNGRIYISNYTFRLGDKKSKYLYIKGQSNWFDLLYDEFCNMWECGKEIDITI